MNSSSVSVKLVSYLENNTSKCYPILLDIDCPSFIGMNSMLSKDVSSFGVMMMVGGSAIV